MIHQVPTQFICPLSQKRMKDPVIAADLECYERNYIEQLFLSENAVSPKTNQPFENRQLLPVKNLKSLIDKYDKFEAKNHVKQIINQNPTLIKKNHENQASKQNVCSNTMMNSFFQYKEKGQEQNKNNQQISNCGDARLMSKNKQTIDLQAQLQQKNQQNLQLTQLFKKSQQQIDNYKQKLLLHQKKYKIIEDQVRQLQADITEKITHEIGKAIKQFESKINQIELKTKNRQIVNHSEDFHSDERMIFDKRNKKQALKEKRQNKITQKLLVKDNKQRQNLHQLQEYQIKMKQQFQEKKKKGQLSKINNYEGQMKAGKKHGIGTQRTQQQTYFGQYVNNFRQGFGILERNQLDSYKGYFKNGIRQQFGISTWPDGRKYTGQWKKDRMSGYGWQENTEKVKIYRGYFVQELYEGQGDIQYHDGTGFTGIFHQDEPKS